MSSLFEREVNRCLACVRPSCKEGCPLSNDFSEIIKLIRRGEFDKAVQTIGHPFGEICGYVCPHETLCQGACVLGKRNDPVLTGVVERELFAAHPYVIERASDVLSGCNYAVIGGGVSGLTFSAKAYEHGADVTVFERDELLSTIKSIPSFRLPKEAVLRAENAFAGKIMVERAQIDADGLNSLKTQFDGVYVATGLSGDYGLGVDGQQYAVNYRDCLRGDYAHGTVVVVGGGNSAMDCARLARAQGNKVFVAYRRTEADMPAFAKEIASVRSEGVEFLFNAAPVKLDKHTDKLQLLLAKTVSEGRGRLTVTSDVFSLCCDSVIAAIGGKFDGSILREEKIVGRYLQYDNVYLGGDAKCGKLVVDAVLDGLNVARQIIEERKLCLSIK